MFILSVVCVAQTGWYLCAITEEYFRYSQIWDSVHYKSTCLKCQLGLYLPATNILEEKCEQFKKRESNWIIWKSCMLCFHVIIALMQFFSGACQEEVSVFRRKKLHILSFCPFPHPNTQRQRRDKRLRDAAFLYVVYPGKSIASVKSSRTSLKAFSED